MLPEAEQLSCVRDVGSARALVPGTIARGRTYMARTDTSSVLLLTILQVTSHNHHVFRQLNIHSHIMGPHGVFPASESR